MYIGELFFKCVGVSAEMTLVSKLHNELVYDRRLNVLASHLCEMLPNEASVLDIGCGDGKLDKVVQEKRPDISIRGIDVLKRPKSHIRIDKFDGEYIPCDNNSFDVVMFIDVIHHASNQMLLLEEAERVTRKSVLIKDHTNNGCLAKSTLMFMDWVGNRHHGVALPYNYWTYEEWLRNLDKVSLDVIKWRSKLKLYPLPARWVFDRGLHFIAMLSKRK